MECPIKNHAFETSDFKGKRATRDCIKEACAWWMPILDRCCISALALILYNEHTLIDRGSFAKYVQDEE
jgi:hypothetical protein